MRGDDIVCLLDDKSLVDRITDSNSPLIVNLQARADWYEAGSPVQASSVDLHIGKVFLPGKTGKAEGSQDCPLELHALQPGQTAIVSTLEELRLPSDIAAIGFPPSNVSVQGLLMTNPGHVDPGYAGPMRFAVINFGKSDYVLRRNDAIVTLLFMKLVRAAQKNWLLRRNGKPGGPPTQKDLNLLSPDFLDVRARAVSAAKVEVENAGIKLKAREVGVALLSAALGAGLLTWITGVQDLKTKVAELEKSLNVTQVQQQMTEIDRRVKAIEQTRGVGATPTSREPKSAATK